MNQIIHSQQRTLISRDEMNLAEFPLTVLSTRANPNIKTLEFCDNVKGKNGEIIERKWTITSADKFGLPTASDDEVLLGLIKLTVDDGMRNRKVYFTRYELLKILRWTTEGRSYSRLQNALDRLSGVRIKAENAFYDNEIKSHSTKNFAIVDEYEINDGRDERSSFFSWSDVMFQSFQVGFIKKLDLDFYLELKSAVSKRLFRYLDKHFWYKNRVQVSLFVLAHEKIGISRNYKYASSLKQQLEPAFEELMERGFLSGVEYQGEGRDAQVVLHSGKCPRTSVSSAPKGQTELPPRCSDESEVDVIRAQVHEMLVARGLQEASVHRMLETRSLEMLKRTEEIVRYFDLLLEKGKVTKSKQGFLFFAVNEPAKFTLPGDGRTQAPLELKTREAPKADVSRRDRERESFEQQRSKSEYLVARKQAIRSFREKLSENDLQTLRRDAELSLLKLKGKISSASFEAAVLHGIEEKLAKQIAFPEFALWLREQGLR